MVGMTWLFCFGCSPGCLRCRQVSGRAGDVIIRRHKHKHSRSVFFRVKVRIFLEFLGCFSQLGLLLAIFGIFYLWVAPPSKWITLLSWNKERHLTLLSPAMSELPRPVDLTLNSSYFNHILGWKPGPGTPSGVHYRVAMTTTASSSWVPVAGCEHVEDPTRCNLTHAFSDRTQVYLTQVTAVLEGRTSPPNTHPGFQPIRDTYLDPPLLSVTSCDVNLCVDLRPPLEHLSDVYRSFHYHLRIQTNGVESVRVTEFMRREVLDNLAPGRRSCVSVRFSGILVHRKSNYSQPVCASTAAGHHKDVLLSVLLCLLVFSGPAVVALLVATGYVSLRRRPLPFILTSIHHVDRMLVLAPSCTTLTTLLSVEPTAPSSGDKWNDRTLTEENEPGENGSAGGSGGGNYTIKVDLNQLLPPSSSPFLPLPEPPTSPSSHQTSDSFDSPPPSNETPPWGSDRRASVPPADTLTGGGGGGGGGIKPDEEEEALGGGGDKEVNLLTLTFGWKDEEEEGKEGEEPNDDGSCASDSASVLPTQTEEGGSEMFSPAVEEEEEEEENSGYILHPYVFRN